MDNDVALINTRVPFLGFMFGSMLSRNSAAESGFSDVLHSLFGVTILQAYQYFLNYGNDTRSRKVTIVIVCFLDCLHFTFSAIMICAAYTSKAKFADSNVIWSMKAVSTTDALLLIFVQSFYLHLIWIFAESMSIPLRFSRAIKAFSVITFAYAIGIASALVTYMVQVKQVFRFSASFKQIVCMAIGSTAGVDSMIAIMMVFVLYKMIPSPDMTQTARRGIHTVNKLVLFFVASGSLTALCAVIRLALFASDPSSTLYLSLHFSIPRLYANSILALFNSKARFQKIFGSTTNFHLSSLIIFGDSLEDEKAAKN